MTRRRLRTTLTILGIVIGIFALTTMGAMAEHYNALFDGGVQYYSSNVPVGAPDGQASILPLSKMDDLKHVAGVQAVYPGYEFLAKPGEVSTLNLGIPDYITNANPDERRYSRPKTSIGQGRDLTDSSRGEVVLGSSLATEFKKKVGDSIDLPVRPKDARPSFVNHTYTVVGIQNSTGTFPDSFAYVSTADAQILLRDSLPAAVRSSVDTGQVAMGFAVYGQPGASLSQLDQIANRVNPQVDDVKATRPSDLVSSFKAGSATFTAITTAAAVLALVIGGLSVANTMIMAVTERFREIGLKKAIGAHTGRVLREYLAEATL